MKNTIVSVIAVALLVGGGAFYGGIQYAESKLPGGLAQREFQNLRNLSPEERAARMEQFGMAGIGFREGQRGSRTGTDVAAGEIIAKDETSITIKLRAPRIPSQPQNETDGQARLPNEQGGSRIIFFSDTTSITKSTKGSFADLTVGTQIFANGSRTSDGSMTAETIQIR